MKILFLGYKDSELIDWLRESGEKVIAEDKKLNDFSGYDFIISYGYRYLINPLPDCPAINLHISFLPYNRGVYPNVFSWIEQTPKGITIHEIDAGIDTGNILTQVEIDIPSYHTLESSYWKLRHEIERLFKWYWKYKDNILSKPQQGTGSFHTNADFEKIKPLLKQGWNTPVMDLIFDDSNKGIFK